MRRTSFIILGFACWVSVANAGIPSAYHQIANEYQIPVEVFYAVMLQESGKTLSFSSRTDLTDERATTRPSFVPWPWVLNVELKPYFFESREQAAIALKQFLAANKDARIAVGLGQIYLPSHGHLFTDKTLLLDPAVNLNYAAQLLATEFQWTVQQAKPNWWVAVGRYHTPSNNTLAKNYREDTYHRCQTFSNLCAHYGALE